MLRYISSLLTCHIILFIKSSKQAKKTRASSAKSLLKALILTPIRAMKNTNEIATPAQAIPFWVNQRVMSESRYVARIGSKDSQ